HEPFLAYFSKDHPLLKKSKVSESDLDLKEVWLLNEDHCLRDQVLQLCRRSRSREASRNLHLEASSLSTLLELLDSKAEGFTFIPALMSSRLSAAQARRLRPFSSPQPSRKVSLVYHRSYVKRGVLNEIFAELMKALPESLKNTKSSIEVLDPDRARFKS